MRRRGWRVWVTAPTGLSVAPHQMPAELEVMVLEMRRAKPYWGARSLVLQLARKGVDALPSESAVYRCLVRAGVIDPVFRRRRRDACWRFPLTR